MTVGAMMVPMRANFDGHCFQCSKTLPSGEPRQVHIHSRRIYCVDCAERASGVTRRADKLEQIQQLLESHSRQLAKLEKLIYTIGLMMDKFEAVLCPAEPEDSSDGEEQG